MTFSSLFLLCLWSVLQQPQDKPATKPARQEYTFVPDAGWPYYVVLGNKVFPGHLDETGEFVFSTKMHDKEERGLLLWRGYWPLVRSPNGNPEVYEYRSGILIPGRIEEDVFVPDLGGKIIDFNKYQYSPQGRAIYNLPGYFIPRTTNTPKRGS